MRDKITEALEDAGHIIVSSKDAKNYLEYCIEEFIRQERAGDRDDITEELDDCLSMLKAVDNWEFVYIECCPMAVSGLHVLEAGIKAQ